MHKLPGTSEAEPREEKGQLHAMVRSFFNPDILFGFSVITPGLEPFLYGFVRSTSTPDYLVAGLHAIGE